MGIVCLPRRCIHPSPVSFCPTHCRLGLAELVAQSLDASRHTYSLVGSPFPGQVHALWQLSPSKLGGVDWRVTYRHALLGTVFGGALLGSIAYARGVEPEDVEVVSVPLV